MQSEVVQCESEEPESAEDQTMAAPSSNSDDLNNAEFLVNLEVWHTKLVDELFPKLKKNGNHKNHRKGSGAFKSLFGSK